MPPGDASEAKVTVHREESASWPAPPTGPHDTSFLQMAPGELRLQVEGIARFRISDGQHIAFEPWQGEGEEQDLRTFLLGSAVGALLIQRGLLVLHGNALEREGRAIVCLGHSGAGKSTLAYALMEQGWRLLADDLVAISPEGLVLPGIPRIKLWQDAVETFGLNPQALPPIAQGMNKYVLMGGNVRPAPRAVPLQALYLITPRRCQEADGEPPGITPVKGQKAAFVNLRNQAYRPSFLRGLGQEGSSFVALAQLQRQVPLATLSLPSTIGAMRCWLADRNLLQEAGLAS